jgi:N-terminal acetyltransferase B complex non-catalytic subunit
MAYVRVSDFKSQQTVALQLYKVKPKNPYYFWAVMSIVLQALKGPESKDNTKSRNLLMLAQRMIDKLIDGKKIEAEQEVQLYLSILEFQEKYEDALKFLDSEICNEFFPGAPITLKIELLKKLGKWSELKKIIEDLLLDDADRWDYWQDYLQSCFNLIEYKELEIKYETISEFIQNLQSKSNGKLRGPFLARLKMHKMMRDLKLDAVPLLGDYQDLLVIYFNTFGSKKCCGNDLKMFLEYLEPSKRSYLATRLLKETGIGSTSLPQDTNQLQRHICSLQISRFCGAHSSLSVEHLQAIYSALSLHYEHSFNYFDVNLLPTDIGLSDQYALLAGELG